MRPELPFDESLVQRLPLPLAQLYRRAHNAKTPLDCHLTAFYLWEASLKLMGCAAIITYADQPAHDPAIAEKLQSLARPSLGHWWDFVRTLLPILAEAGVAGVGALRETILGRTRDDFPRAAGLDAALPRPCTERPAPGPPFVFPSCSIGWCAIETRRSATGPPGSGGPSRTTTSARPC